ncbi:Di-copper centre-containing protein [Mycena belliarum]|uniref:Di-copper centre-containing protein n=1 Tax=Mycena belliarum TaxID=1033014 RepID=A0AAD6UB94_9AGAR|nr:Di-copper centre-containing protein [Mycena belliae]
MPLSLSLITLCLVFVSLLSPVGGAVERRKCSHPAVRKEWRSLPHKERADWITAVNCLAKLPHDRMFKPSVNPPDIAPYNASGSLFDGIGSLTQTLNSLAKILFMHTWIHYTGQFLPWHRWYINTFDQALRSRCGYRGSSPYWDWTKGSPSPSSRVRVMQYLPVSGLGGWGAASTQYHVLDGAFSASSSFRPSYPYPHIMWRNYTLFPPLDKLIPIPGFVWNLSMPATDNFTRPVVEGIINGFEGDFRNFHATLESGPHTYVHLCVSGDMAGVCPVGAPPDCITAPTFSANDPLFFLHHAMVDRIWYKWQHKHKSNKNAFFGGSVQRLENATAFLRYQTGGPPFLSMDSVIPTNGLATSPVILSDVMSTTEGPLCYIYD